MSNIIYNGMRTPDGTIIESRHRYDYVTHLDANGKTYTLDGGLEYYSRSSANGDEELITVTLEDGHEKVRDYFSWGTYGKEGDQPLHYVKLKDMDTDHIEACLRKQQFMPSSIRTAMENELEYRSKT